MGAALGRAAQWTSVSGSGKGKLELSPMNEKLLNDIIQFVESFPSKHPEEGTLVFKDPLAWDTSLTSAAFSTGFDISTHKVTSEDKDDNGSPLVELSDGILRVRNMKQAANVLKLAKEKCMNETRLCLEANHDPLIKILGPAFATVDAEDTTLIRMFEKSKTDESRESSLQLNFYLVIQQFDKRLLESSMQQISQQVRLSPSAINAEVELLKTFAGDGSHTALKEIDFTSQHEFSNQCRALPWRQVHGDICYILVKPHDGDRFCVTATTYGCYVNGGFEEETQQVKFEKTGEVFKDLVSLLREKSQKFSENIAKKEFSSNDYMSREAEKDTVVTSDQSVDNEKEEEAQTEKQQKNLKETGKKGKTGDKKRMQPSLKWKSLEESRKNEKIGEKQKKKKVETPQMQRRPSYF